MRLLRWTAMLVLLAGAARAQDPLKTLPANYWLELDAPWVRVVHAHYGAGEHLAQHDHPKAPTLWVYLSDAGPVRFEHTGDDSFVLTRKPVTTGQWRMSPGREETHRVVSESQSPSDFLRVEFKPLPLGLITLHASAASAGEDFWRAEQPMRKEFDDAHVRITRIGVQPGKAAELHAGAVRTVWVVVRGNGAQCAGKPAHAGQAVAADTVRVQAGNARLELLQVELK